MAALCPPLAKMLESRQALISAEKVGRPVKAASLVSLKWGQAENRGTPEQTRRFLQSRRPQNAVYWVSVPTPVRGANLWLQRPVTRHRENRSAIRPNTRTPFAIAKMIRGQTVKCWVNVLTTVLGVNQRMSLRVGMAMRPSVTNPVRPSLSCTAVNPRPLIVRPWESA